MTLIRTVSFFVLSAFLLNTTCPGYVWAQELNLPQPGTMIASSPSFNLPVLTGIKVYPENPFKFDFILDVGDGFPVPNKGGVTPPLREESNKLIKYFLASLTTPEKDLWVNLSPYEKNRIVPEGFGQTEMGMDLLAQDYILKQLTASLIYPEGATGKMFWKRIYEEAAKKFGTTNIPVNTFNKVWIVPEKAVVYENAKSGTAYIVKSSLKVMLEQDYLALSKHAPADLSARQTNQSAGASEVLREIVIPALQKEVNQGKNFAQLRQVYQSLILAAWYKRKIKDSILDKMYVDQNKDAGVNINDPKEKEKIYQRYLQAFKKGAYNYIKEETDPMTQQVIPRKYFSGGMDMNFDDFAMTGFVKNPLEITTNSAMASKDINRRNLLQVLAGVSGAAALGVRPAAAQTPTGITGMAGGQPAATYDQKLLVQSDKYVLRALEAMGIDNPEYATPLTGVIMTYAPRFFDRSVIMKKFKSIRDMLEAAFKKVLPYNGLHNDDLDEIQRAVAFYLTRDVIRVNLDNQYSNLGIDDKGLVKIFVDFYLHLAKANNPNNQGNRPLDPLLIDEAAQFTNMAIQLYEQRRNGRGEIIKMFNKMTHGKDAFISAKSPGTVILINLLLLHKSLKILRNRVVNADYHSVKRRYEALLRKHPNLATDETGLAAGLVAIAFFNGNNGVPLNVDLYAEYFQLKTSLKALASEYNISDLSEDLIINFLSFRGFLKSGVGPEVTLDQIVDFVYRLIIKTQGNDIFKDFRALFPLTGDVMPLTDQGFVDYTYNVFLESYDPLQEAGVPNAVSLALTRTGALATPFFPYLYIDVNLEGLIVNQATLSAKNAAMTGNPIRRSVLRNLGLAGAVVAGLAGLPATAGAQSSGIPSLPSYELPRPLKPGEVIKGGETHEAGLSTSWGKRILSFRESSFQFEEGESYRYGVVFGRGIFPDGTILTVTAIGDEKNRAYPVTFTYSDSQGTKIVTYEFGTYGPPEGYSHVSKQGSQSRAMMAPVKTASLLKDAAMPGGIDFNTSRLNLQLQNAGRAIRFHPDAAMLRQLQNAPGLTCFVIDIQPMNDLRGWLGINN